MSRIGKQPVALPQGVKSEIKNGLVFVEGPKGKLQYPLGRGVSAKVEDGKILFSVAGSEDSQVNANYGTARATVNNMVTGVTKGWKKTLEMTGVGFNAKLSGQELTLACGFSHDVKVVLPPIIKCSVTKTTIDLESVDKEVLGKFAAQIRKVQPPEPYLGKGIKYSDEVIRRKAGKAGKK